MADELMQRGYVTQRLGSALHSGKHGLENVPGLLKMALEEHAWEHRMIVETGEEFEGFPSFEAYISANPPKGLGVSVDLIRRMVADNAETLDMLNQALGIQQVKRSNGNGVSKGIRRLSKDRPDLLERVQAGELSTRAAMREAGFQPPTYTVNLASTKSAAALVAKASPVFLDELRRLLNA